MSRQSGNNIIRQDSFSSMNQSGPLTFEPRVCSLANRGLGLEARSLRNESIYLAMEICLRVSFIKEMAGLKRSPFYLLVSQCHMLNIMPNPQYTV
ncbi:hypothetical protein CDAR_622941 [Caerostris darwini]|uniref:Uncharacterized protein n=1 Tax=Caerostris darwini TaxID=1538125 RepID=A0AAV4WMH7_9ARAC|nr:hypothetical protein CDAR_622941 [Caerostris darwini]